MLTDTAFSGERLCSLSVTTEAWFRRQVQASHQIVYVVPLLSAYFELEPGRSQVWENFAIAVSSSVPKATSTSSLRRHSVSHN
jgi:hypothetical protein